MLFIRHQRTRHGGPPRVKDINKFDLEYYIKHVCDQWICQSKEHVKAIFKICL